MGVALALAIASVLLSALFLVVVMSLARLSRVWIQRAFFGSGPRLFSFVVGSTPVTVRAIPTHSYVEPLGANLMADAADDPPPPSSRVRWLEAPAWRRAVVFAIAPRLCALALASLVLGPDRACRATAAGTIEILRGSFGPFTVAREVLQAAGQVLAREGLVVLVALATCKGVSLGFITLPTDLAQTLARRHSKNLAILRAVLMMGVLMVLVAWLVAWVAWLVRGA